MAYGRLQGFVERGGKLTASVSSTNQIVPAGSGATSAAPQRSFPLATVAVYLAGTLTLATIYSDAAGTAKSNPFTADVNAYWFFYAANGTYDVRFSGSGIDLPFALSALSLVSSDSTAVWVNVLDYGAIGDGVTDNLAAFTAAEAAVVAGGTIYFPTPAVAYLLTSEWTISKNVRLLGAGEGSIIKGGNGSTATSVVSFDSSADGSVVESLKFDGNSNSRFINIDGAERVVVRNCYFTGGFYAQAVRALNSASETTIRDNYFVWAGTLGPDGGSNANSVIVIHASDGAVVRDNRITRSALASNTAIRAIFVIDSNDSKVVNNTLWNKVAPRDATFGPQTASPLSVWAQNGTPKYGALIEGNTVINGYSYNIYVSNGMNGAIVKGNTARNGDGIGIVVASVSDYAEVIGNFVIGMGSITNHTATGDGIFIGTVVAGTPPNFCRVIGNTAISNIRNGIHLENNGGGHHVSYNVSRLNSAVQLNNVNSSVQNFVAWNILDGGTGRIADTAAQAALYLNNSGVTQFGMAYLEDAAGNILFLQAANGAMNALRGVSSISATATAAANLRGTLTVTGAATTGVATFAVAEPNTTYFLSITPISSTGAPAAGSNRVLATVVKTVNDFTITVEAAPGVGNTVTFEWILLR